MRILIPALLIFLSLACFGQADLQKPFRACGLTGSITMYDHRNEKWIFSDAADASVGTSPASTFKVINLLIALEAGVIKNEHELVRWPGTTDTSLYGYRPEIYHNMTVKEAFKVSAGWVFTELAKRVGRHRYRDFLKRCNYGNGALDEGGVDFWNFGAFAVSPNNQVQFLVAVYEGKTPFSKRSLAILRRVMVTEQTSRYAIRSKTGWTRAGGKDIGWWIGWVEKGSRAFFFATRVSKDRAVSNPRFASCRISITKEILKRMKVLE